MLSVIDGNTSEIYITRSQSLLKQVSNRYNITETEIGDRLVVLCHKILRDEYGINQTLQYTLEAINRIEISSPNKDDFNKLLVVYGELRNAGQTNDEAVKRINMALQLDRNALNDFFKQR